MSLPRRSLVTFLLAVALIAPAGAAAQTGVITTVAGTGTNGFSGDESTATEADLGFPVGLVALPDSGFIVTSHVAQMPIRRVYPDGTIGLFAGGTGAGSSENGECATTAKFDAPNGMARMPDGAILVADSNNHRIRRIGTECFVTRVAGTGIGFGGDGGMATEASLNFPADVAMMPDGGFLIADTDNHRIRRVAPGGTISTFAGTGVQGFGGDGGPATSAQLSKPISVAVEPDGDVLIADRGNHRIRKVSGGTITTVAGTGTPGALGDGGDAALAQLSGPTGVAVAPDGGFVIADRGNHGVRRVLPDGTILMAVGDGTAGFSGDGGLSGDAQLNGPIDVGFTPSGDLLVTDTGNHRVRRVDLADDAGPGPGTPPPTTLTTIPTPPAPPPAPAPVPRVTAVAVAEPDGTVEVGETNVLEAKLSAPAERIDWDVTGDGKTDVSCDGEQTGLMFRPKATASPRGFAGRDTLRVSAKPYAPSIPVGAPPTRFEVPLTRPTVPPELVKVAALIDKKPATYACGRREDLALERKPVEDPRNTAIANMVREARQRCSVPTTIKSGALEATGCVLPIREVADIPESERGMMQQLLTDLGRQRAVSEATLKQMTLELSLTFSRHFEKLLGWAPTFITASPLKVNGMTLTVNDGNAFTVVFPQMGLIGSSNASAAIGDIAIDQGKRFLLDTAEREGKIVLNGLKRSAASKLKSLGGFPFAPGNINVTWENGTARIKAHIELPAWMSIGKQRARAEVEMRANNAEGLVIDKSSIGPLGVEIGALTVKDLRLAYTRVVDPVSRGVAHVWDGSLRACILKACLEMAPDKGGVRIVNGQLEYLGLGITFPTPVPIATGVDLRSVGFRMGLEPPRFGGTVGLTFSQLVEIDGGVSLVFATADEPWIFRRAEVGNAFPAAFEGQRHTTFTLAVAAEAYLREVPIAGRLKLGDAYLLYEAPAFVAFGGGISAKFKEWVSITGRVDGAINADNGRFSITGNTRACLFDFLCTGGIASVSSVGAGGCVSLGPVQIGGGILFDPFAIKIWPLDGCKWTRFIDRNVRGRAARAAQAGGVLRTVTVKRGDPSVAMKLDSAAGAPQIRVSGPGGKSFVSTAGPGLAGDKTIRILRSEQEHFTVIGLQDAPPGDYRVEVLPGSPPVTKLGQAEDPPDAKADVTVEAGPREHVLRYDIQPRPRQRVIFQELGADGRARDLGGVSGGGRGTIRFTPSPGIETRRIRATFELDGLIAEQQIVARFRAPSAQLTRIGGLRATRTGKQLSARWRPVAGATRYVVVATLGDGSQRTVTTRSARARLASIPRTSRVRLTVQARAEGRQSSPSTATLVARGRVKTKFGPLPTLAKRTRR